MKRLILVVLIAALSLLTVPAAAAPPACDEYCTEPKGGSCACLPGGPPYVSCREYFNGACDLFAPPEPPVDLASAPLPPAVAEMSPTQFEVPGDIPEAAYASDCLYLCMTERRDCLTACAPLPGDCPSGPECQAYTACKNACYSDWQFCVANCPI